MRIWEWDDNHAISFCLRAITAGRVGHFFFLEDWSSYFSLQHLSGEPGVLGIEEFHIGVLVFADVFSDFVNLKEK